LYFISTYPRKANQRLSINPTPVAMKLLYSIVLCLLISTVSAQQENPFVALGIGTGGVSISAYKQMSAKFSTGVSIAYLNFRTNITSSLIDQPILLQPNVKFTQAAGFVRWYPTGKLTTEGKFTKRGFFMLFGMAIRNKSMYQINTTLKEPTQIGQLTIGQTQTGDVKVFMHTRRIQPFTGIGFLTAGKKNNVSLSMEAGFFYHGNPETSLEATGTLRLNARNEAQLNKNLQGFTLFPLIQAHLGIPLYKKQFNSSITQ
jgi:hypothetical protein